MRDRVLVLLSSGLRRRYRDDVLRVLAMPRGARLRFRYGQEHVDSVVRPELSKDSLSGASLLLCYLNVTDPTAIPNVVPCRFATLISSRQIGRYVTCKLSLGGFASHQQLAEFQSMMTERQAFPKWHAAESGGRDLKGSWVHAVTSSRLFAVETDEDLAWQAVVSTLAESPDFASERYFYRLEEIRDLRRNRTVQPFCGVYNLRGSTMYEISVLHFDPSDEPRPKPNGNAPPWILVKCEGPGLNPVSGAALAIDSPYDEKKVRFETTSSVSPQRGLLRFLKHGEQEHDPDPSKAVPDFEIEVGVAGDHGSVFWRGLLLGGLLSAQQLFAISKTAQPEDITATLVMISIVLSLITGWVALLNLRKPG